MAVRHTGKGVDYTLAAKTYLLLREACVVGLDLSLEELTRLTSPGRTRHHCFQVEACDETGVLRGRSIADVDEQGLVLVLATRQVTSGDEGVLLVGGQFFLYPAECGGLSSGSDGHYELELDEGAFEWTRTSRHTCSYVTPIELISTSARRGWKNAPHTGASRTSASSCCRDQVESSMDTASETTSQIADSSCY